MSFNIQCAMSQQIIADETQCHVVIVSLRKNNSKTFGTLNNKTYALHGRAKNATAPDATWGLESAFISGTHFGEGRIHPHNTEQNRYILLHLFTELSQKALTLHSEDGEHTFFDLPCVIGHFAPSVSDFIYSDAPFSFKSVDQVRFQELASLWAYLEDSIHQNSIFIENENGVPTELRLCAIHQEAFKNLLHLGETLKRDNIDVSRSTYFDALTECISQANVLESGQLPWSAFYAHANTIVRRPRADNPLLKPFVLCVQDASAELAKNRDIEVYKQKVSSLLDSLYVFRGATLLNLNFTPSHMVAYDKEHNQSRLLAEFMYKTALAAHP